MATTTLGGAGSALCEGLTPGLAASLRPSVWLVCLNSESAGLELTWGHCVAHFE